MLRWPSLSLRLGLGAQRHWYCWSARSLRLGGGVPGSRHDLVMSIGLSRVRGLVQGPLSAACCRRCPLDLSGPCTSCVATLGSQPLLRVPAGIDRLWALASYTDPGGHRALHQVRKRLNTRHRHRPRHGSAHHRHTRPGHLGSHNRRTPRPAGLRPGRGSRHVGRHRNRPTVPPHAYPCTGPVPDQAGCTRTQARTTISGPVHRHRAACSAGRRRHHNRGQPLDRGG